MGQTRGAFELLARLACWRVLEEVPDDAHEIPFRPFVRQRRVERGNDDIPGRRVRVLHCRSGAASSQHEPYFHSPWMMNPAQ